MFYQGLILAYLMTSILEHAEDMDLNFNQKGKLHFCETYKQTRIQKNCTVSPALVKD